MRMLLNMCEFFDIDESEFFSIKLASPAIRALQKELDGLTEEDIVCLTHIVRKMKK